MRVKAVERLKFNWRIEDVNNILRRVTYANAQQLTTNAIAKYEILLIVVSARVQKIRVWVPVCPPTSKVATGLQQIRCVIVVRQSGQKFCTSVINETRIIATDVAVGCPPGRDYDIGRRRVQIIPALLHNVCSMQTYNEH